MNRKVLLLGGAAAVGLLLLSGKKASASTPPALPKPMLELVPKPKPAGVPVATAPGKVELVSPIDEQAAANAAAAAAASAQSPPMSAPATSPPGGSLVSTSSPTAPQPATSTPSIPDGYDPVAARKAARSTANHLSTRGRAGYSRPLLKQWQRQAGLTPDGIYGGATRGALLYYGVSDPPQAFFKPVATIPYAPPV